MPAEKITTVNDYVKLRVPPEHRAMVGMLRQLMRELAPNALELMSYEMPSWKGNWIFAYIIATKKDITFGFSRGAQFEDKFGLLKGRGKSAKHVKLDALKDVNRDALRCYVEQALELDAK